MRLLRFLSLVVLPPWLALSSPVSAQTTALGRALLASETEQPALIRTLLDEENVRVPLVLEAWRTGEAYLHAGPDGARVALLLDGARDGQGRQAALVAETGEALVDAAGLPVRLAASDLTAVGTNAAIRRAIRDITEVLGLGDPSPVVRRTAAERLGMTQRPDYEALFLARLAKERNLAVLRALNDGVALIRLKNSDTEGRLAAVEVLRASNHLGVVSQLKELAAATDGDAPPPELAAAARAAVQSIELHYMWVNFFGTVFRGFSLGSVLLVTALGLAITYGLMGVINMAHGEIMVVGAYATFVTQNLFARWFGASGAGYDVYFLAALPVSFCAAALVGLALERGIIQWLYRRPLESLLATWGVSLALQQAFRTIFGPANVQINSPSYLQGNVTWFDIAFTYNRIFVIIFAVVVLGGTWLLLTKTRFGLYIRAVTQNRAMASCMGVRTERVNMLTFAFGSGLAGLAGACLSQLGNVGPGLGQSHIVDCFMVVVSGGVGSLAGTAIAAFGIGSMDQILQPFLGAVMGKILVLVAIILFLQWKPGGLFPTRNRSLD